MFWADWSSFPPLIGTPAHEHIGPGHVLPGGRDLFLRDLILKDPVLEEIIDLSSTHIGNGPYRYFWKISEGGQSGRTYRRARGRRLPYP